MYPFEIYIIPICFIGVVRDCFVPSSIVLGPIDNPILPEKKCRLRNIANDQDDDIKACLCTSPLCNLANSYHANESRLPKAAPTSRENTSTNTQKSSPDGKYIGLHMD